MENNSNSALKINQVIAVLTTLVILGTSIQLFNMKGNEIQIAKENVQEEVKETIEVSSESYERTAKVTSRSEVDRTAVKENKIPQAVVKYKKIEEITISQSMDLSVRCGISKEDFNKLMSNLRVDTSGFFKRNSNTRTRSSS